MLSTFLSLAWPAMAAWYTYTKAHIHITKLISFRLSPSRLTYSKLSPVFRPDHVQSSCPHPAILDWVPFPILRQKLVLYHSANPQLDTIICDIQSSFVVEADASQLIEGFGATPVYLAIWDLVAAIESNESAVNSVTQPSSVYLG